MNDEAPCAPRPWTTTDGVLRDAKGNRVVVSAIGLALSTGRANGDAIETGEFLLKAVNNFDAMAKMRHALTVIAEACEEQIGDHHLGFEIADPMKFCEATRKIARTALEEK